MRQIILDSIYLHNFKSFHQPTEIKLSVKSGLKFWGGRNLVEPRLGSNGGGKSSFWDALCWCWFGTGARGQKATDLVTWGETKPHVITRIRMNETLHEIERHGSPNRLLIDKAPANQEDVEQLLGLSRDRFLQSVVFGQGVPLFLDMNANARGELLDGILDLSLWMTLSEDAGRQATLLGRLVSEQEQKLAFERGRLAGAADEEVLQRLSNGWQQKHDAELEDLIVQVADAEDQIVALPNIDLIEQQLSDALERFRKASELQTQADFYDGTTVCPTCQQSVTDEFAHEHIKILEAEINQLCDENFEDRINQLKKERSDASRAKSQNIASQTSLNMLVKQVERLGAESNPYVGRLAELQAMRTTVEAAITEIEAKLSTCKGKQLSAEYWKTGFKKVRLYLVKQVLTRMGIETANAASALGIGSWKIEYVTEVENKSGTMRPGIQVLVNGGRWESFSGGEAQRIRLAVTLGIASMIQNMAAVDYGFEVWDEASQYLSIEGIEDLLTCLQARAEMTQKSIFVVDHTALSFGGFAETWSVTKDEQGSRVSLLSQSN